MNYNSMETQASSPERSPNSPIYNKGRKFKTFTVLCAVLLSVFCGICFNLIFNIEDMYFTNSPLVYVFCGLLAATVISALIFVFVSNERLTPSRRRASAWFGWLAGLEMLHLLIILASEKNWLPTLLTVAAIVYFIGACHKNTVTHTLLGILTVGFCVAMIAKTYFANDIPVNSPFKLLCQFGIALFMLLVTCELRFDLDGGKPRAYMLASCLTFCINLCAVAANLALTLRGMDEISVHSVPACAIVIYSAKFLLLRPHNESTSEDNEDATAQSASEDNEDITIQSASEDNDNAAAQIIDPTEEDHDEKGQPTDENIG